ncbi:MAG: FecR domain-containing protein [Cyclobacteriaceae bacterium]
MGDIHEVLVSYFSNEADDQQKSQAEEFRKDHPDEFILLEKMWKHRGDISIVKRDSEEAWQQFQIRIGKRARVIPIHVKWRRIAAVAALVVLSAITWNGLDQGKEPDTIEVAAKKAKETLEMPDGSMIHLNRGASISYMSGFGDKLRKVVLEGEAFFDVAEDVSRPFIIVTTHAEIRVLGTSFNVRSSSIETSIAVREGRVQVNKEGNEVILTEGFTAMSSEKGLIHGKTTDLNFDSWKTGIFSFNEATLTEVFRSLNTYYGGRLILEQRGSGCSLSAEFSKDSLEEIVEILSLTCELSVKSENGNYLFN